MKKIISKGSERRQNTLSTEAIEEARHYKEIGRYLASYHYAEVKGNFSPVICFR